MHRSADKHNQHIKQVKKTAFARKTHIHRRRRYKLQPEVTPQVKSLPRNLRSTVKVTTMRLQGPQTHTHTHTHTHICTHTINRALFLWISPSLHPSFSPHLQIISSHVLLKLPCLWAIKWQTRSNYCNVITRTPCFLPPPTHPPTTHLALSTLSLSQGKQMRPNFPFSLMWLNQSDDAGSCL